MEGVDEINKSGHSSLPSSDGNLRTPSQTAGTRKISAVKRRSSLFSMARMSFVRSGGQRGASLETLRGTTGGDFEANAEVERGTGASIGCCCFGSAGLDKNVIVFIKGPFCFVYKDDKAAAPKYAISLSQMKSSVKEPTHGKFPVTLGTLLGDVDYEIFFADQETANLFSHVVSEQASASETEAIRKRLGHEHLLHKRASVRYAETIAMKKINDQPDAPVTTVELMDTVQMEAF